jgi:hypothetical protein
LERKQFELICFEFELVRIFLNSFKPLQGRRISLRLPCPSGRSPVRAHTVQRAAAAPKLLPPPTACASHRLTVPEPSPSLPLRCPLRVARQAESPFFPFFSSSACKTATHTPLSISRHATISVRKEGTMGSSPLQQAPSCLSPVVGRHCRSSNLVERPSCCQATVRARRRPLLRIC